jgi:hypothetical protein
MWNKNKTEPTFQEEVFEMAQRIDKLSSLKAKEFFIQSLLSHDDRLKFNKQCKILETIADTDKEVLEAISKLKDQKLLPKL